MPERLPFVVEPMALSDLGHVMAIERRSFSAPWSERAYRYEIEQNRHNTMLVVRPVPRARSWLDPVWQRLGLQRPVPIVGYGGLWLLVDEAHISTIAVHPDWRGRGLGELLLVSLLERGAQMGARVATLEVRVSNYPAQGLYLKYGFTVAGRQRHYYSDNNEDAFIMVTPPLASPEHREAMRRGREQLEARLKAEAARLDKSSQLG